MTFLSKFRQNLFQLTLLLWGSMLLLASSTLILTTAQSSFEFFFLLLTAIPQVFSFWGLHFIFSYIYRSIPSKKVSWIILFIEVLTISIPIIIEIPLLFYYKHIFDYYIGICLFATNTKEAFEFLHSLGFTPLITFLFTLVFSLWGIYALIPRLQISSKTQNTIKKLTYPSLRLLLLCIISWMSFIAFHAYHQFIEKLDSPIGRIATPIDRFFWVAPSIIKERINTSYYLEEMKSEHHFQGFSYKPTIKKPLKVVVILGESARADLMSAYGYNRPTTPWLDSISKKGDELVLFNDVCSAAPNTIFSSQRIFTYWNNTPHKQWYNYPDLTNVLRHSGYYTQWLTNQNVADIFAIEKLFATSAHSIRVATSKNKNILNSNDNESQRGYDELLLPLLKQYDAHNSTLNHKNTFTVLHLMGSHVFYDERYPKQFEYFHSSEMKECLTSDAKRKKSAYLNTLRYTDFLLKKIIKHYSSERSLVFYFSDHGEMIDEPQQRGFFGHGTNVDHPSIDVPFFVYASPKLRKEYPEIWKQIKNAKFRPISTAWFTNSLTSLLGIHTKYNDEHYNFFSNQFNNPTRIAVYAAERKEVPPLKYKRVK